MNRADKTMEKKSLNNILKLAVDWKPQCTKELIEKIESTTELHFLDYRSALHDSGNNHLARNVNAYNVNDALWCCKSDDEKEELFLNFLKQGSHFYQQNKLKYFAL